MGERERRTPGEVPFDWYPVFGHRTQECIGVALEIFDAICVFDDLINGEDILPLGCKPILRHAVVITAERQVSLFVNERRFRYALDWLLVRL